MSKQALRAAMYLRKSRAEELTDTTEEVLSRHRQLLDKTALSAGVCIQAVYMEVVSGESLAKRPKMKKLLAAVRHGLYDAVLCIDIDRLGRGNMKDQGEILDTFRESGTLIITPDKTYDLNDDTDEELTEFKAFFARREWKVIRKRMQRGLDQTVKKGGHVLPAPYGYRRCWIGSRPNEMPSLEIIPEEADIVRRIYAEYAGGTGSYTIAERLNRDGIKTRRGGDWSRVTIREILRNPTYKGYIAVNRLIPKPADDTMPEARRFMSVPEEEWELFPGLHPAITPEKDWMEVQIMRKQRQGQAHCYDSGTNPLAKIVYCGKCGKLMLRAMDKSGNSRLYCRTRDCCASTSLEYVEQAIVGALSLRLEALITQAKTGAKHDPEPYKKQLAEIDSLLSKCADEESMLYSQLEDGAETKAGFAARRQELNERRMQLMNLRDEVYTRLAVSESEDPAAAAEEISNILALWPESTAAERNRQLRSVLSKVIYTKEKKTPPREFSLVIEPLRFIW